MFVFRPNIQRSRLAKAFSEIMRDVAVVKRQSRLGPVHLVLGRCHIIGEQVTDSCQVFILTATWVSLLCPLCLQPVWTLIIKDCCERIIKGSKCLSNLGLGSTMQLFKHSHPTLLHKIESR